MIEITRKAPKRTSDSQKPFSDKPEVEIWRNPTIKLAAIDFLFDPNTNYGSIRNRFYETNSGFGGTGSTDIGRRRTSKTVLEPSTSDYRMIKTNFGQKHHLPLNRKWKYGENPILQLTAVDFLFDFYTMYGSIGHRFNAGNYFRSRRNRKYKI